MLRARRLAAVVVLLASACAAPLTDLGDVCASDPEVVANLIEPSAVGDVVVRNVRFSNCGDATCVSTDRSRPYCSHTCESDDDCELEGFACTDFSTPGERLFLCTASASVIGDLDAENGLR